MSKSSMLVVGVVAVVLIGFGAWAFLWNDTVENNVENNNDNTATTSDNMAAEADHVVAYEGGEFQPSQITVQAGDTVAFANESDRDVWPASDVHPQHTELPGFDAMGSVAPGETYTYTFEEVGEWGYHDHLSETTTGVVIVE